MKLLEYIAREDVAECESPPAAERWLENEINERVLSGDTLEAVMDYVFERTEELFPCDRLGMAFVEEEEQRIVARWARARYEPILLGLHYSEDFEGSSLEALRDGGRVRVIHDLPAYLARKPESASTRILVEEGVRSSMTCPLFVDRRLAGFLFRSARRPAAYGRRDVSRHLRMARHLALAVDKAYRMDRLRETNRAYLEMLGFVSHEIKNPLGAVITTGKTLLDGYLGPLQEAHRRPVERMVKRAEYLAGLVREYLDLARAEGGRMKADLKEGVDLASAVLDPAMDMVREEAGQAGMTVERRVQADVPPVTCDPGLLHIVVTNLLGNAVKYGREGGVVRLSCHRRDGWVEVTVWNEGPGFPAAEQGRLFRRFSRLQTPELLKRKGTGIGLYTAWRIMRLHGGTIRARSEEGRWAEFTASLPYKLRADGKRVNQEGAVAGDRRGA